MICDFSEIEPVRSMIMRDCCNTQTHTHTHTFGAKNAYNGMKRRAILPAPANLIPSQVLYALSVYAREPP